jgi:hypothetical protein
MASTKKLRGQFYTTNYVYILDGLTPPPADARCVIEPFAGKGDLLTWVSQTGSTLPVEAYDIEPKHPAVVKRDTLASPPDYADAWIITNPPYLARNKCASKTMFDKFNTNDLYKCFLTSLAQSDPCRGGILIIPAGFFFSPRDIDERLRHQFMSRYRITRVKYFEEQVFDDTSTTVVAIQFERAAAPLSEQAVEWLRLPQKDTRIFPMSVSNGWIVGGEIYSLSVAATAPTVRRHVEGLAMKTGEQQTHLTLCTLDSGTAGGELGLEYREGYVYPAKDCSRTYATLRLIGRTLTAAEQRDLSVRFNEFVRLKREAAWSLFLPQYRESKEYARKRMPFELAYRIVQHLLG